MAFFGKRNTYDSPFDDYKLRAGRVSIAESSNSPDFDLTRTGAILMVLTSLSFAMEFVFIDKFLMSALVIAVLFLVWMTSLRFLMIKKLPALNIFLNYCYFVGIGAFIGRYITDGVSNFFPLTSIPLVIGLSMFGYTKSLAKLRDTVFIPFVIPFAFSVLNIFVLRRFSVAKPFVMIFLCALEILLLSVLLSSFTGKLILFAGTRLTDVTSIPQNGRRDLLRFTTARMIDFAFYMVITTALLFVHSTFGAKLYNWIYLIIIVFSYTIFNSITELLCKNAEGEDLFVRSNFVFDLSQFMNMILQSVLIILFFFGGADKISSQLFAMVIAGGFFIYTLFLGFTAAYKRRLVFAEINNYAKGVTHYLLIIGVILMILDAIVVV